MDIVGYGDHLSVRAGETISFMVSCTRSSYSASLVRLIHGDSNSCGPGVKEVPIPSSIDGTYGGRDQPYRHGSYVLVRDATRLDAYESMTIHAWIFPTTPGSGEQAIIARWSEATGGIGLFLDAGGALSLRVGAASISTGVPVRPFEWYEVTGTFDAATHRAYVDQRPVNEWPGDQTAVMADGEVAAPSISASVPLVIAATFESTEAGTHLFHQHFNGKIDAPRVFAGVLGAADLASLRRGDESETARGATIAAWDFARDPGSAIAVDVSGNEMHGVLVNMPMRAVTGWNWSGREIDFRLAPAEYGAIFFHEDDLEDAGWEVDFEFDVPPDLRSGVYAVRLASGDAEDYVPFFVRPLEGTTTSRLLFLAPTFSYLAYGNDHFTWKNPGSPTPHDPRDYLAPQDWYVATNRLLSTYDRHIDDTGCCFSSRLRPIVSIRPKYNMALLRAPHQFNADLHLVDWLETMGHAYDVATDEDLHFEGHGLLKSYTAVVTGSHHEYWSEAMLDAVEAYLNDGGRLVALSGNTMYWPVGVDPERPHIIEVRRGQNGTGTWRSAPGESRLQLTGEPGGLWRDRGRAPQRLLGNGMAAAGYDYAVPYRRQPDSFDPRVAFIFEGLPEDPIIGDEGLVMGGAAGLEVDRFDRSLGSPPHALVVATASGFSSSYQRAVEEVETTDDRQGGPFSPFVRGDMVFFETPKGGAVFSVGSITWCGSLASRNYENPVSRITHNVIRKFVSSPAEEFSWPDPGGSVRLL
jgi:N,N-dimethylformamidase